MSGESLVFDGVTARFDGTVGVRDVNLEIGAGERVALVGPSGAGKTTLLRLGNGSVAPDSGRVRAGGETTTPERVALAYQGDALVGRRSALANVLTGRTGALPWWRGLIEPVLASDPDPALDALDAVGLAGKADARADELSAGERGRVALAAVLVRETPVVLADEPTANLDPASRTGVLDALDDALGARTALVALHDTELAVERFERVVGLRDGEVAFDRAAEDVHDALLDGLFAGANAPEHSPEPTESPEVGWRV